jgi:hypothetical protein
VVGGVRFVSCSGKECTLYRSLYWFCNPLSLMLKENRTLKRNGRERDQTTPSNTINKTEPSQATKRNETFDLQIRFHSNTYALTLSLFAAEYYVNFWITTDILIIDELMGLFYCIWGSSCVCVCVCVGEWEDMMECLLVLHCAGFPEDTSSPTVRTLCSWLFYLCSGNGRANPCICTLHTTGIRWQRNSHWWQLPSRRHSKHVTWSDYINERKNLTLTVGRLLANKVYFPVNISHLYIRECETHPTVTIKWCVCHIFVISTHMHLLVRFGMKNMKWM